MPEDVVEAREITKRYGNTLALDAVDLSVQRGSVFGLVGPNGAGKTTLLGVLAGLRRPTEGTFTVNATRVAVLPDTPKFDPWMTAREVVGLSMNLAMSDGDPDAVLANDVDQAQEVWLNDGTGTFTWLTDFDDAGVDEHRTKEDIEAIRRRTCAYSRREGHGRSD